MPLVIAGATSGSTTIQATDAVTATITLPSATDTLVGKITPSFTTTIGVGAATPSASGAGITFPATQSASTDANTLDDYEEGGWTPTLSDGSGNVYAISINTATYTKIGSIVHVQTYVNWNSIGSVGGSGLRLNGLPFVGLAAAYQALPLGEVNGMDTQGLQIACRVEAGNAYATFNRTVDNSTPTIIAANVQSATGYMVVSGVYRVN
jgi:hypothetical protein